MSKLKCHINFITEAIEHLSVERLQSEFIDMPIDEFYRYFYPLYKRKMVVRRLLGSTKKRIFHKAFWSEKQGH